MEVNVLKKIYREKSGHHINMVGGRKQRECKIEQQQIKKKDKEKEEIIPFLTCKLPPAI